MQLGTRSLTLNLGGFERAAEVSDCRISSRAIGTLPRRLFQNGTVYMDQLRRDWRLQGTAVQDSGADSLWGLVWEYAGTEVPIEVRPAGGVTPSEEQPFFTGLVVVSFPEGDFIGGKADKSTARRFTFDLDWPFVDKPERVTS